MAAMAEPRRSDPSTRPSGSGGSGSGGSGSGRANKPGRFTPKQGGPASSGSGSPSASSGGISSGGTSSGGTSTPTASTPTASTPTASGRYTPPAQRQAVQLQADTSRWVLPVLFGLLVLGGLVIILNYMDVLLPGAPSNWWLLGGLGGLVGALVVATQLK
jgi:hypothetical protein